MLKKIKSVVYKFVTKIISMVKSVKKYFQALKRISDMEKEISELKERLADMETFMESAKSIVKETPQRANIERKRKWLQGYPDETERKV